MNWIKVLTGTAGAVVFLVLLVARVQGQPWTFVEVTRTTDSAPQTIRLWTQPSGNAVLEVNGEDGTRIERRSCLDGVLTLEDSQGPVMEQRDLTPEACTNSVSDAIYGIWRFVTENGVTPVRAQDTDSGRVANTYEMPASYEVYATVTVDDATHIPLSATTRSGTTVTWVFAPPVQGDPPPTIQPGKGGDVYQSLDSEAANQAFGAPVPDVIGEYRLVSSETVQFASRPTHPLYGLVWRNDAGNVMQAMLDVGMSRELEQPAGVDLSDPAQVTLRIVEGQDLLTLVAPDVESLETLLEVLRPNADISISEPAVPAVDSQP